MRKDVELLNDICKNTEMGCEGIQSVMRYVKGDELKNALMAQHAEYERIYDEASDMLREWGEKPEGIGTAAKIASEMSSMMGMMSDDPDSKIAEMMMEGSTKGIVKITRQLKEYGGDDGRIQRMADRLLNTERDNLEQMKNYL